MYEHVSNNEIATAIEELFHTIGAKEDIPHIGELIYLLERNQTQTCIQRMAEWFGLPIRVELSYVGQKDLAGANGGFHSTAVSRTGVDGRGVSGITAQVSVPNDIPIIGSSKLNGYPIQVRVTKNCRDHPETFIAVMAHELSHVLLAALWHPRKDSEMHADLVPLLLGFRFVVMSGRKTVRISESGQQTVTHTTTYGYLPDDQFDYAVRCVAKILAEHRTRIGDVRDLTSAVNTLIQEIEQKLVQFQKHLTFLGGRPTLQLAPADAQAIVRFHGSDYTRPWEIALQTGKRSIAGAEPLPESRNHYRAGMKAQLIQRARTLSTARTGLELTRAAVHRDVAILVRTRSPLYQIWHSRWLRRLLPRRS